MRIALTLDADATKREENDYIRALVRAGAREDEIIVLPPGSPVEGEFDGVLLGGGVDVDPSRYGRTILPDAGVEVDPARDETDFTAFDKAWREETPILGICRGLQVVNVALGGTLVQDIPRERPSEIVHQRTKKEKTRRDHTVGVVGGTRLHEIAATREISVNSRHHQAIEKPAPGLAVSATAPDGTIEGIEVPAETKGPWLVAVQWHPENLAGDPVSERLFAEFVRAARLRASGRKGPQA